MSDHKLAQANIYEFVKNELPDELRQNIERHVMTCNECRNEVTTITAFLQELDSGTVDWSARQPEGYWNSFAYSVQDKIIREEQRKPGLFERFVMWLDSVIVFKPRDVAIAGAMCAFVLLVLITGKRVFIPEERTMPPAVEESSVTPVDSEYVRLHDYFRKSRALLIGLANAKELEGEATDYQAERTMSRSLINETRVLKQKPLDPRSERLIKDMEKILIKIANSGTEDESPEMQIIRRGIERENLLHKIRRAEATYRQP